MRSNFKFDVFLIHNPKDKSRVRRLAERLKAAGVVYHHLGRELGGHDRQIEWWIQQLGECIGVSVAAVRFRRGTSRAFFLISGGRAPRVVDRLELLRESAWIQHNHLQLFEHTGAVKCAL